MTIPIRPTFALTSAALAPPVFVLSIIVLDRYLREEVIYWPEVIPYLLNVLLISSALIIVAGIPIYLLFQRKGWVRWWSTSLVGYVVGGSTIAVRKWPTIAARSDAFVESYFDGEVWVDTFKDGAPTMAGWIRYSEEVLVLGFFGAISGLVFWIVWRALKPTIEID